jgi:zinc protease
MPDRSRPPRIGAPSPFRFPSFDKQRLENGLQVYLAPCRRGPLIHLHLTCPGGAQFDPPAAAGRATLVSSLLDEGTERLSALEIAAQVEQLGGYLVTQADWDAAWLSIGLLSQHLDLGLQLLSELARQATFPEGEIDRLRRRRLANLRRRLSQPSLLAADGLASALYTESAYASPLVGTATSIASLRRDDLVGFYRRHVTPSGSALIAVGDLEIDSLAAAVSTAFQTWHAKAAPAPPAVQPRAIDGLEICVVDRPDSPQTELLMGHAGVSRKHPEFARLQVLNALLGGKFTSRINLKLREQLGITYGAHTDFSGRLGPGPFVAGAAVATDAAATAVREILAELRQLQQELVPRQELEEAKSYLLGVFPYTLQRIEGVADRLADLATYGLADDHYNRQLRAIRRVEPEDVRRLARDHLRPDAIVAVAVGPRETLQPQLETLAPVRFLDVGR